MILMYNFVFFNDVHLKSPSVELIACVFFSQSKECFRIEYIQKMQKFLYSKKATQHKLNKEKNEIISQ